jgi:hypothetical protein
MVGNGEDMCSGSVPLASPLAVRPRMDPTPQDGALPLVTPHALAQRRHVLFTILTTLDCTTQRTLRSPA